MAKEIKLHPEKGVNARLCFCPRCGGESQDLALIGDRNFVDTCVSEHCKMAHYGGTDRRIHERPACNSCGCSVVRRPLEENERIPSADICDQCKQLMQVAHEAFKTGGIMVKCTNCFTELVLSGTSKYAIEFREKTKTPAPLPIGSLVTLCTNCQPKKKETPNAT